MKIDKRNPLHWLYLLLLGINVIFATLLRPLLHRRATGRVLLYGHKRSGNLRSIHDWVLEHRPEGLDMRYLTMDPSYYQELRRHGVPCVLAIGPAAIAWLGTADAVVSDHGLHAMEFMLGTTDLRFFDVWHGIPFKGFDANDFKIQRQYDETWVASPLLASMYMERFGFSPVRVKVTGYARTDGLSERKAGDKEQARSRLGLPGGEAKVVLFAPTWKQDDTKRSLFPFGTHQDEFLSSLSALALASGSTIVIRTHINSTWRENTSNKFPGLVFLSHAKHPETEDVLLASDILICDWSSIAFDFLLLERPTIFLDLEPPFAKGFSLGPEFRYGALAGSFEDMVALTTTYLADPGKYASDFGGRAAAIKKIVYGSYADGAAAKRCVERLASAIFGVGSFNSDKERSS